jgi:hypothetical protein
MEVHCSHSLSLISITLQVNIPFTETQSHLSLLQSTHILVYTLLILISRKNIYENFVTEKWEFFTLTPYANISEGRELLLLNVFLFEFVIFVARNEEMTHNLISFCSHFRINCIKRDFMFDNNFCCDYWRGNWHVVQLCSLHMKCTLLINDDMSACLWFSLGKALVLVLCERNWILKVCNDSSLKCIKFYSIQAIFSFTLPQFSLRTENFFQKLAINQKFSSAKNVLNRFIDEMKSTQKNLPRNSHWKSHEIVREKESKACGKDFRELNI